MLVGEVQPPPDDPGNSSVDFHGAKRRNEMHCSTTAPDASLAWKGAGEEAKLGYGAAGMSPNTGTQRESEKSSSISELS